jgi:hypothetical protein
MIPFLALLMEFCEYSKPTCMDTKTQVLLILDRKWG